MSWPLIRLALEVDAGIAGIEKLVLIELANQVRQKSVDRCYPAIETVARATHLHARTVQSAIRRLESVGLIRVERGGGRYRSSVYILDAAAMKRAAHDHRIDDGKDGAAPPFQGGETVAETVALVPERVAESARKGGGGPPEPEKEPEKEPERETRAGARTPSLSVPLPDGFPGAEERTWAMNEYREFSAEDVLREAGTFRNWHSAEGRASADWPASWRIWMGRAHDRRREKRPTSATWSDSLKRVDSGAPGNNGHGSAGLIEGRWQDSYSGMEKKAEELGIPHEKGIPGPNLREMIDRALAARAAAC